MQTSSTWTTLRRTTALIDVNSNRSVIRKKLWVRLINVSSELISTYYLGSHFTLRSSIRKPIFYMWEKFCVVVLHGVTTVVDGVTGAANDLAQHPIWQKFLKNNFLEPLQNTVRTKSALPVSRLWSRDLWRFWIIPN